MDIQNTPYYCDLCEKTHSPLKEGLKCPNCGRFFCRESVDQMIAAGRSTCAYCEQSAYSQFIPIQRIKPSKRWFRPRAVEHDLAMRTDSPSLIGLSQDEQRALAELFPDLEPALSEAIGKREDLQRKPEVEEIPSKSIQEIKSDHVYRPATLESEDETSNWTLLFLWLGSVSVLILFPFLIVGLLVVKLWTYQVTLPSHYQPYFILYNNPRGLKYVIVPVMIYTMIGSIFFFITMVPIGIVLGPISMSWVVVAESLLILGPFPFLFLRSLFRGETAYEER